MKKNRGIIWVWLACGWILGLGLWACQTTPSQGVEEGKEIEEMKGNRRTENARETKDTHGARETAAETSKTTNSQDNKDAQESGNTSDARNASTEKTPNVIVVGVILDEKNQTAPEKSGGFLSQVLADPKPMEMEYVVRVRLEKGEIRSFSFRGSIEAVSKLSNKFSPGDRIRIVIGPKDHHQSVEPCVSMEKPEP